MKLVRRPGERALAELLPLYEGACLTYPEQGVTAAAQLPGGYHHVERVVVLPGADFEQAAEALLTWQMHRRAGLVVAAAGQRAAEGVTTVMALRAGPVGVVIPCRIVWSVEELDRRGFAYGTLTGHPERGEEAFVLERRHDRVLFTIRAFSRAGDPWVRAAGPLARLVQAWMTGRYLRSLPAGAGRPELS